MSLRLTQTPHKKLDNCNVCKTMMDGKISLTDEKYVKEVKNNEGNIKL